MSRSLLLVTGGSGAIGGAVCMRASARGLMPIVGYRQNADAADAVAAKTGGFPLRLDLGSAPSIDAAVQTIEACQQPLAGIVLAASPYPEVGPFSKITVEQMTLLWKVNVLGSQLLLAGLIRTCLRKQRSGCVVGVLSKAMGDGATAATAGLGAYVIAKHGMEGVLAATAADYPWLRVRSVKPSFTESKMLNIFDQRFLDLQRAKAPFATPDEIAAQIIVAGFPA